MLLTPGHTAVVTGGASGIGLALGHRFAAAGMNVVLADVEDAALADAVSLVNAPGPKAGRVVGVRCDVRHAAEVETLAASTIDQFGAVHVVCNNAGVAGGGDPWFGPLNTWEWTIGVNLYGVIHGVRAFLGHLLASGGHIVNTASMAGLYPGLSPVYDATKHAVVALTENLYRQMDLIGSPIGVSCLCPGWVRTKIFDAERNFPDDLGTFEPSTTAEAIRPLIRRVVDEGMQPAAVADLVADAIEHRRFWIFTAQHWLELAAARWDTIANGLDPQPADDIPGMPTRDEIQRLVLDALAGE